MRLRDRASPITTPFNPIVASISLPRLLYPQIKTSLHQIILKSLKPILRPASSSVNSSSTSLLRLQYASSAIVALPYSPSSFPLTSLAFSSQ